MLERGGFDGVDAGNDGPSVANRTTCRCRASRLLHFDVEYTGVEAIRYRRIQNSASTPPMPSLSRKSPLAYFSVSTAFPVTKSTASSRTAARRRTSFRAHTSAKYFVRSTTPRAICRMAGRSIEKRFEAGAIATGASLEFVGHSARRIPEFRTDDNNGGALSSQRGRHRSRRFAPRRRARSSPLRPTWRMSRLPCLAIHLTLGLDSLPAVNHQAAFAAHCATPIADKAALDGGNGDGAHDHRPRDR